MLSPEPAPSGAYKFRSTDRIILFENFDPKYPHLSTFISTLIIEFCVLYAHLRVGELIGYFTLTSSECYKIRLTIKKVESLS